MVFMASGREIQGSENAFTQMDRKLLSFPSRTGTNNTNWETSEVQMSVAEESTRKEIGRFNTPMECWGCTNPPRQHVCRFHTYINFPRKRDPDVSEQANQSIKEYAQHTSMTGRSRGDQDNQGKGGKTSTMSVISMFAERRVQLTQSWKYEGFGSLDHTMLICQMMDPYKSK